jgi:hypothetical protein
MSLSGSCGPPSFAIHPVSEGPVRPITISSRNAAADRYHCPTGFDESKIDLRFPTYAASGDRLSDAAGAARRPDDPLDCDS